MAYIGKEPQVGNYVKLDAISTSSTNSYNLTKDSVAFTPESALHMLVSLNGVIQSPLSSFSVSDSTITFLPSSGTLSSSDTIDFILVLGNVLDIGTPSDSTVTDAKANFVSTSSAAGLQIKGDGTTDGTLQLNCSQNSHGIKLKSPNHSSGQSYTLTFPTTAPSADKFLKTDGSGNLSFADAGGMSLILSSTLTSNLGNIDISSTYINSTFDEYFLTFNLDPDEDNRHLYLQVFVGGSAQGGSIYANEAQHIGGNSTTLNSNAATVFRFNSKGIGYESGEGISGQLLFQNVNDTNHSFCYSGFINYHDTNGNHVLDAVGGSLIAANKASVVNGLRFYMSGGQATGDFKIYGLR